MPREPFMAKTRGALSSYLGSNVHQSGKRWAMESFGLGKGTGLLGRALGMGFAGYTMYEGYQQGGVWGAAKAGAELAAWSYGIRAGFALLGPIAPLAIGGAVAYAGVSIRKGIIDKVRERNYKMSNLEMSRPVVDQFGTLATMRQRSIMAIQNSKINGRSSLGSEAVLLYRPYHR
jgi:hypothetical protein